MISTYFSLCFTCSAFREIPKVKSALNILNTVEARLNENAVVSLFVSCRKKRLLSFIVLRKKGENER